MDPLGLLSGIHNAEDLQRWCDATRSKCPEPTEDKESPFPVNIDINERVCLWYAYNMILHFLLTERYCRIHGGD